MPRPSSRRRKEVWTRSSDEAILGSEHHLLAEPEMPVKEFGNNILHILARSAVDVDPVDIGGALGQMALQLPCEAIDFRQFAVLNARQVRSGVAPVRDRHGAQLFRVPAA